MKGSIQVKSHLDVIYVKSLLLKVVTMILPKRMHIGVKPFKCDLCEKTFTQRTSLVKHIRIHTGLKPYECDICGKTFSQNSHVAQHKKGLYNRFI